MIYCVIEDVRRIKINGCDVEYSSFYILDSGDIDDFMQKQPVGSSIKIIKRIDDFSEACRYCSEQNSVQKEKFKNVLVLLEAKMNYYTALYNQVSEIEHLYDVIQYHC